MTDSIARDRDRRIAEIVESVRLRFEEKEREGIRQWVAVFEAKLREGEIDICVGMLGLADRLFDSVCPTCQARFRFAQGQFFQQRDLRDDLDIAAGQYRDSGVIFERQVLGARMEVERARRRGTSNELIDAKALLSSKRIDAAAVHYQLGTLRFKQGRLDEAIENFRKSAGLRRLAGDPEALAMSLIGLAEVYRSRSGFRKAKSYLEKSLRLAAGLASPAFVSAAYSIGTLFLQRSQFGEAKDWLTVAADASKMQNDSAKTAVSLQQLAAVFQIEGHRDSALEALSNAAKVFRGRGDRAGVASVRHQQGIYRQELNDLDGAERSYKNALEEWQAVGAAAGASQTYHQLGMLYHERQQYVPARVHYARSLWIARSMGDRAGMVWTLYQIGRLYQDQAQAYESVERATGRNGFHYGKAAKMYRASMRIAVEIGDEKAQARALVELGIIAQTLGDFKEAELRYRDSLALWNSAKDHIGETDTLYQLGVLFYLQGRDADSRRYLRRSLSNARRTSYELGADDALALLAGLDQTEGRSGR